MSTHTTMPSLFGEQEPAMPAPFVPPPVIPTGALTVADELWIGQQSEEVQAMFARLLGDRSTATERAEEVGYDRGYDRGWEDGSMDGHQIGRDEALAEVRAWGERAGVPLPASFSGARKAA